MALRSTTSVIFLCSLSLACGQGKDNPGARAALLSGVPGVGKSSTATLVATEMGYHVMELNASDTRSKSSLSAELDSVIGNQVSHRGDCWAG